MTQAERSIPQLLDCNEQELLAEMALSCSKDLVHWTVKTIVAYHPDLAEHGFQYIDWVFDGDDIAALSRTACDDGPGGAHNYTDKGETQLQVYPRRFKAGEQGCVQQCGGTGTVVLLPKTGE